MIKPRLQSGIQRMRKMKGEGYKANGLLVRGVVIATYVVDDPNHPELPDNPESEENYPIAVYCDVLSYSFRRNNRFVAFPKVLVLQDRGNMHSGRLWKPKAAIKDVTTDSYSIDAATNPANMDGDHVLIGFMDDTLSQPVILGGIPHPNVDAGKLEGQEFEGQGRLRQLRLADGNPDFFKHNGAFYGIDDVGDFHLDTTFSNNGETDEQGREAAPPTDGTGSQYYDLPSAATQKVTFYDMADPTNPTPKFTLTMAGPDSPDDFKWELEFVDAATKITAVGDRITLDVQGNLTIVKPDLIELGADGSADKAALDSKIQTELARIKSELDAFKSIFDAHGHLSTYVAPMIPAPGPPVPVVPVPPSTPFPSPATPGATNSELVTIDK